MKERYRIAVLAAIGVAIVLVTASLPPIPQDLAYHDFADRRSFLGIANFMDVISNLPFLFVGVAGLWSAFDRRTRFATAAERWPYAVLFLGVVATSAGSAYYHLAPGNAGLVWDRLPMTLGFMGLLSAVLAERVNRKLGLLSLPLLVAFGVASVAYWNATEIGGHGDLRPYLLVQFGSLLIVLVSLLLFSSRYTEQKWLSAALAGYALAKVLETFDSNVYGTLRVVSGHTLKHLAAAAASYCVVEMLKRREIKAFACRVPSAFEGTPSQPASAGETSVAHGASRGLSAKKEILSPL